MSIPHKSKLMQLLRFIYIIAIVASIFMLLFSTTAHASIFALEGTGEETWSLVSWWEQIHELYKVFANISLGLGTISFVAGGFKMMTASEEKEQAQGKAQMKLTLLAVIAIQLIPLALELGFYLVKDYQWDPSSPKSTP